MVRKKTYEILKKVVLEGAYSNLVLKELPSTISPQDMGLLTQIVYGTLQNYDYCSYQWSDLVSKACSKKIEILINMSVYQLLFLDRVPHYAIVNESLNCVKIQERPFVQAILSKVIERGKQPVESSDILQKTAIETSTPLWILQLWTAHYGQEEMIKIAQAMTNIDKKITARINPILITKEELQQDSLIHFMDEWAFTYEGKLLETEYFKSGEIVIQDISSQQVAKILDPKPGQRVLDACSAPGTKTSMMAAMMNNTGEIIACDLHEHRLRLVQQAMEHLHINNVTTKQLDCTKAHLTFEKESFDYILLDVPCSGLGTLSHKPDLKFRLKPSDLDAIIQVQKDILLSCAPLLKPAGTLVYSTCTLNKKENEKQLESFLMTHPEFELMSSQTIFPYNGNQDGFYIAKIMKKKTVL